MRADQFHSDRSGRITTHPTGYLAFIPDRFPPSIQFSNKLINLLNDARGHIGELAGLGRSLSNPYILVAPAIRREAVLSSQIEGTQTGMNDLLVFEAIPREKPSKPDVREVHNYVLALEYGLERLETLPVCTRLARELHEKLMAGVRGQHATPGEFRTTQNWIGPPGCSLAEATYVPPPPEELDPILKVWEQYIHADDTETPDLIKLGLIHAQFELIHPFADGNGRIGRLLTVLLMCHWQLLPQPLLYLSAFFERHRDDYYGALQNISQDGSWEEWLEFFLFGIRDQSKDALILAMALLDLNSQYMKKLEVEKVPAVAHRMIDQLFQNPFIDAPYIRDHFHVNFHTAQNAIESLERLGILVETTGKKRDRVWVALRILEIISGRYNGTDKSGH